MIVRVKQRIAEVKVIDGITNKVRTEVIMIGSKCSATVAAISRKKLVTLKSDEVIFAVKELDKRSIMFDCTISDDGKTLTGSLMESNNETDEEEE